MARKRGFNTFSLSFLDIMSCGFGAVALIFLIIKHDVDTKAEQMNPELQAEVSLLQEEIKIGEENLVAAKNTLSKVDQRLAEAQGLARRINDDLTLVRANIESLLSDDPSADIANMQAKLQELEQQKSELEKESEGDNARRFIGEGNRQYLTGLKLGGRHVLILLDSSASMLDNTIINVIRRKNMDPEIRRSAAKWQKALAITEWLIAQLPETSSYQIYHFNSQAEAALSNTQGQWLQVSDKAQLERVVDNLHALTPDKGTNLHATFVSWAQLDPIPDNIFLITDGLPTLGEKAPKRNTITGPDRLKLFNRAIEELPRGVPVNTVLLPMEGDPMAAAAYWQLARRTDGSFLSPSDDWP